MAAPVPFSRILPLTGLLVLAACGGTRTYHLVPVPFTQRVALQSGQLTAEQEGWLAELCPSGAPELGSYYNNEPTTLIVRQGHALMHSDQAKTPIWVCERVTEDDAHGALTGRDSWRADPVLCPSSTQCSRGAVDNDYKGSGYDRGHLAPNMNQKADAQRKAETFTFSNAAPQVGARFNQSTWQDLELRLHAWVAERGPFWTITGVMYWDEAEEDAGSADGFVEVEAIGEGAVYVPTHFYKIVVWEEAGALHSFAIVMPNVEHNSREAWRRPEHIKTIRWLEERLAVNFLPHLEPGVADDLETRAAPIP